MFDFSILINDGIPKGAKVTPYAMMQKTLCVIEGERAKVYQNRKLIRKFFHYENALKKKDKLIAEEEKKAYRILSSLTKNKDLLIRGLK